MPGYEFMVQHLRSSFGQRGWPLQLSSTRLLDTNIFGWFSPDVFTTHGVHRTLLQTEHWQPASAAVLTTQFHLLAPRGFGLVPLHGVQVRLRQILLRVKPGAGPPVMDPIRRSQAPRSPERGTPARW